jgi:hypothetical protein
MSPDIARFQYHRQRDLFWVPLRRTLSCVWRRRRTTFNMVEVRLEGKWN